MSRGRNGGLSNEEQERIANQQIADTRSQGKKGSGAVNFEHKGFGSEKGMQTNAKGGMPADKKGI